MQFTVPTKSLADALAFVSAVVPPRSVMPVTEHARLELVGPKLALVATDLDIERSVILDVTESADGLAVVPCRPLTKLLARLPDSSDVKIDAGAGKLTVRTGRGHWSLPLLNDAFPVFAPPGQSAGKFLLSQSEALRVTRRVTHSISDEETRYYLNGAHLCRKKAGLFAVSTDSRRLTETLIAAEFDGEISGVIIPRVMVETLHDIAEHGAVEVFVDDRKLSFACDPWRAASKLIDGVFPDYSVLLPKPSDNQVTVDSDELLRAIARHQAIAAEDPAIIGLCWNGEDLQISLARQAGAQEEIPATLMSGTGRVALQSKYLTDAIRALDCEAITIDQATVNGPAILTFDRGGHADAHHAGHVAGGISSHNRNAQAIPTIAKGARQIGEPMTSLAEQAAAVRRAAINHNGHVANLRDLVARKKRPRDELNIAAQWLPALLAAADTMEALAADQI